VADLGAIRAGLAALLTAQTGVRAHADAPGSISPPCAVILPGRPAILYGQTMGTDITVYGEGEVTVNLLVIVLLSAANDVAGQDRLDKYVSSSGSQSVNAAVNKDPTLGHTVEFAVVQAVQQYGLVEYAGQQYMGATLTIQAGASL
jgi:hypothetical protein